MRSWISILLVCFGACALADERERLHQERQERIALIRSELSTIPDHPWAGEYISGPPSFQIHLWIAPKAGAVRQFRSCFGFEGNVGTVTENESEVSISWKWKEEWPQNEMDIYVPVRWGKELFLIAQHEHLDFGVDARSASLYLESYPFRRNDQYYQGQEIKPQGQLVYPQAFEKFRDVERVQAVVIHVSQPTVTDVNGKSHFQQAIMINAGTDRGVFPKMKLSFSDRKRGLPSGIVKVADGSTATLWLDEILDSGASMPAIQLGDSVETRRSSQ